MDAWVVYTAQPFLCPLSIGLWEPEYAEETKPPWTSSQQVTFHSDEHQALVQRQQVKSAHSHKQQTEHQILWQGMEQSSEVIGGVPTQKGFVESKADLTEKLHAYSGGGSFL